MLWTKQNTWEYNLINIWFGMRILRLCIERNLLVFLNITLSQIYRGIVEPHSRYCCTVWGSCGDSRLLMLQKLQNRAARKVTNSSYDAPAANLIKELKWPTVHDMIKEKMATIFFKSIRDLAPTYLFNLFTRNSTRDIVNLRNS